MSGGRVGWLAAGLARLAAAVTAAAVTGAGIGLAVGAARGSAAGRSAALGLYLTGAALVAIPLFSWAGTRPPAGLAERGYDLPRTAEERRAREGRLGAYVAVGVCVLVLGALVDTLAR